jgi:hypothetical protein
LGPIGAIDPICNFDVCDSIHPISVDMGIQSKDHAPMMSEKVGLKAPNTTNKQTRGKRRNSNNSPCKNIVFKKSSKRNQNPSRYYNSITNVKIKHKPKYHLSKILI